MPTSPPRPREPSPPSRRSNLWPPRQVPLPRSRWPRSPPPPGAIRPGRPIALGQIARVPFIGLPGNPVAVMVTFMRLARPAILKLAGCTDLAPRLFRVRAGFDYKKKIDRREWLRARLVTDADGALAAEKFPRDGAGILSSMVEADGLVELPEDLARLEKGEMVDFLPFSEVSR